MIDITKFNGHTAGPWKCLPFAGILMGGTSYPFKRALATPDARLIAAAPDLLAEVIRLRAALEAAMKWHSMATAPKDGTAVLALLDGSNVAHPVRWLDAGNKFAKGVAGWHVVWDLTPIAAHDGPIYWMPIPDAPAAHDGFPTLKNGGAA